MKSNPVFSEDVVPVTDLKINPARVITQFEKTLLDQYQNTGSN